MTEERFLDTYNPNNYDRPSITTDIVALCVTDGEIVGRLPKKNLSILMIKRNEHPYREYWALPGGFVKIDETLEECAIRELEEETNVKDVYMEQLYTFSEVDRDPRMRIISSGYLALMDRMVDSKAGTDAKEAIWFNLSYELIAKETREESNKVTKRSVYKLTLENEETVINCEVAKVDEFIGNSHTTDYNIIDKGDLAFDHCKIIVMALDRLRGKVEYTDIAFNLMPELFTLKSLQQVYELLLGKELVDGNFRKAIASIVEETDQEVYSGRRKAKLYRKVIEK